MSQGGSHASVVFKSYPDDSNAARFEKHYSRCNKNILKKKTTKNSRRRKEKRRKKKWKGKRGRGRRIGRKTKE